MTVEDPAIVATTETEFEAQTKAAVLRDHGIETAVTHNAPSWTGQVPISQTARGSSVLVRRDDLERARAILAESLEDSEDLDWDQVDVGDRADDLPLHAVGRVPPLLKLAFALAVTIVILSGVLALVALAL